MHFIGKATVPGTSMVAGSFSIAPAGDRNHSDSFSDKKDW